MLSERVLQYERSLSKLAVLMADECSESANADDLRDELADIEYKMTEEETEFVAGLSSDLYMIEDDEILDPPADHTDFDFAWHYGWKDWLKCLELLRRESPNCSNECRAFYRGEIYSKLECYSSALEFYRWAIKLNNMKLNYYYKFIVCFIAQWKSKSHDSA